MFSFSVILSASSKRTRLDLDSEGSEVDETEGSSSEDESDDNITISTKVVTIQTAKQARKFFLTKFNLDHIVLKKLVVTKSYFPQKAKKYTKNVHKAFYLKKFPTLTLAVMRI